MESLATKGKKSNVKIERDFDPPTNAMDCLAGVYVLLFECLVTKGTPPSFFPFSITRPQTFSFSFFKYTTNQNQKETRKVDKYNSSNFFCFYFCGKVPSCTRHVYRLPIVNRNARGGESYCPTGTSLKLFSSLNFCFVLFRE